MDGQISQWVFYISVVGNGAWGCWFEPRLVLFSYKLLWVIPHIVKLWWPFVWVYLTFFKPSFLSQCLITLLIWQMIRHLWQKNVLVLEKNTHLMSPKQLQMRKMTSCTYPKPSKKIYPPQIYLSMISSNWTFRHSLMNSFQQNLTSGLTMRSPTQIHSVLWVDQFLQI